MNRHYFSQLIAQHHDMNAVVLGCTEYPLIVDHEYSILPIVDPLALQTIAAVRYALDV